MILEIAALKVIQNWTSVTAKCFKHGAKSFVKNNMLNIFLGRLIDMRKFKVNVTVYHAFYDIEASSEEEAKELAASDYIWDDHIMDVILDVEEMDDAKV